MVIAKSVFKCWAHWAYICSNSKIQCRGSRKLVWLSHGWMQLSGVMPVSFMWWGEKNKKQKNNITNWNKLSTVKLRCQIYKFKCFVHWMYALTRRGRQVVGCVLRMAALSSVLHEYAWCDAKTMNIVELQKRGRLICYNIVHFGT